MAEAFGVVTGALSVAALFNNCVGCFEYIQLGRHFAEDYGRCRLKIDVAQTRLTRWGEVTAINRDPRFATDKPDDESVQQVQDVLEEIDELFQSLQQASKRYTRRAKPEDMDTLQVQTMQPAAQKVHGRLRSIVTQRRKGTSFLKKAAWALYDAKNFEKLINEITGFIDALEKLIPADPKVHHTLVEREIEEVDDKPSLDMLHDAARDTDSSLAEAAMKRLETFGGRNYAKAISSEETARVRLGNEWSENVMSRGIQAGGHTYNEAESVAAKGQSTVHIGNSYGGRSIFDK